LLSAETATAISPPGLSVVMVAAMVSFAVSMATRTPLSWLTYSMRPSGESASSVGNRFVK
jgi:hypothetical protein